MIDLSVSYLGLRLKNPLIVGASYLTGDEKSIKKIEDSGAAAIVLKSLFEEEIQLERFKMDEDGEKFDNRYGEMLNFYPKLNHSGPQEYILWLARIKQVVSIPVIASLNAVEQSTWIQWAKKLEQAGADALELNLIDFPEEYMKTAAEIEEQQLAIITAVRKAVRIPLAAKLCGAYTNPLNFMFRAAEAGASGLVIFNRFFEPDIDVDKQENVFPFYLSAQGDYRRSLRFAGLGAGQIDADICCSNGVHEGIDIIKLILAGATCVQAVSALYRKGIKHIGTMLADCGQWMEEKGYSKLDEFRGKLRKENIPDPWVYSRTQYIKLLLDPKEIIENFTVL